MHPSSVGPTPSRGRLRSPIASFVILALCTLASSNRAHAQVKPRFVIAVDTSGSMLEDLHNHVTYGDGVGRPSTGTDDPALVRDGVFYGCGTTAGVDHNCDGLPNDSKIAVAKDAIRKMILAFGDVEWSLSKFHQNHVANTATGLYTAGRQSNSCTTATSNYYWGNPQCNTGTTTTTFCNMGFSSDGTTNTCSPGSGSFAPMKQYSMANGDPAPSNNATPYMKMNYGDAGCTNSADLLVGFPGTAPFTSTDNRPAILKWMDNVETNFDASTTSGNFCNHATGGDCELRPNGQTPLGYLIANSGTYLTTTKGNDASSACRPYSIILLTDGTESCQTNTANVSHPRNAAFALAWPGMSGGICNVAAIPGTAATTKTYVVGISTNSTDTASLDNIAACGGTTKAYPANTPAQLSAALSDIVSKSIPVEVCNGLDDDCDTKVDEGIPFGQPGSAAQSGALFCDKNGKRSDAQNTQIRLRPDIDDNIAKTSGVSQQVVCGRVVDDCTTPNSDDDCDGKMDEDGNLNTCGTCPGATEVCDGIDNDCDSYIDEKPVTPHVNFSICPTPCTQDVPCGSSIGACVPGVYKCLNGSLATTCTGAQGPTAEKCDKIDNDCNGVVDDPGVLGRVCDNSPYGTKGICVPGMQYCAAGSEPADSMGYRVDGQGKAVCIGQVGPGDREICDGVDQDCDGNLFTCTSATCVVGPQPEHVGDPCGQGVGSCLGTLVCDQNATPPKLVCNAPGGSPEICDNLDNDCDGKTDEGLGSGDPCGSSVGECRPGVEVCAANGTKECSGSINPIDEVCDGLDNDCDGKVDEGLALGEKCGSDEGECQSGKNACSNGKIICSGEVTPQLETCDCADNDCDGKIDEDTGSNPVCPGNSVCTMCQCALPCSASVEFAAVCPQGKAPIVENDQCYCVGERCRDTTCRRQTITANDQVQCAPNSTTVGTCQCKNNECSFMCDGINCGDLICDPTDGRCKQPSCLLPQFACSGSQRCGLVDGLFQCLDDPCAFQVCGDGEACREGTCVKSCARVTCPSGQKCSDGVCAADKCSGVTCDEKETCDASNGKCVLAGICAIVGCPDGNTCDAVSGVCAEDPCLKTTCATDEKCNSSTGQCELRCTGAQLFCDGACTNPASDRKHCGATGNCSGDNMGSVCDTGLVCSEGSCAEGCAEGLVNCGGDCINPTNDATHCGANGDCSGTRAGSTCSDGESCVSGRCRAPATGGSGATHDTPGRSIVAAGGGGCAACSIGSGTESVALTGDSDSTRSLASLWFGLGILGLLVRRSRSRTLRRTGVTCQRASLSSSLLLGLAIASTTLLDGGCKVSGFCLNCEADGGSAGNGGLPDVDSGFNTSNPDGQVEVPDAGSPLDNDAAESMYDANMSTQPDACGTIELCNGIDDDCDGTVDEDADPAASNIDIKTNASHCGGCGKACSIEHAFNKCVDSKCDVDRGQGDNGCDIGYVDLDGDATNGCEYKCNKTLPEDTACDQRDNDCNGKVDEDVDFNADATNCGLCGLKCIFAHASGGAVCQNGQCGLDVMKCDEGFLDVDGKSATGCEYKCPVWPVVEETCNALDDDCDGTVDENITNAADGRIDVDCGSAVGECRLGKTVCMNGAPICAGSVSPVTEICDNKDNDCNGVADNGIDRQTDPGNCGTCGNQCVFSNGITNGHATLVCQNGACKAICTINYTDANGNFADGCEKSCNVTGNEVCDNIDNDCDGVVDNNITLPMTVCTAYERGVCAANQTVINSLRANGPQCVNGAVSCNPSRATIPSYEANETTCDGKDNDCDGKVDEMIPAVGQPCTAGIGACQRSGVNVCDTAPGTYKCSVTANTGASTAEACDGTDNNCNGVVDDFDPPTTSNVVSKFDLVDVGSGTLMMKYEASRSDADGTTAGVKAGKPCSTSGKLPWANVTWAEATSACCSLNTGGTCPGNNKGWRLCDSTTWETACKGPGAACTWGYSNTGSALCAHASNVATYAGVCLGSESTQTCTGGASQCATTTGNASFAQCRAALNSGDVFDLSGNLKEWTNTSTTVQDSSGTSKTVYEQRGGSFNNVENGRTCAFNFTVGDDAFRFPTTGFRCCYYP